MDSLVLHQLQSRSAAIHVRWERLLRIEPVSGPLANPDALARLIPQTLAVVLEQLKEHVDSGLSLEGTKTARLPACDCGHNPYLAYFIAAEQAFVETLVLIQSELPAGQRHESDIAQLIHAVRTFGRDEIDTFCAICAHRCRDPKCRHRVATSV